MALSSMTGFARGQGVAGAYGWVWEIRSVNAKGMDLRLRLPPGWDAIEPALRARAAEVLARGTLHATLNVEREGAVPVVKVNEEVLQAVIGTLNSLAGRIEAEPARLDGILAIKGVIEVTDAAEREDERTAAQAAVVKGFDATLADLTKMRRHEGELETSERFDADRLHQEAILMASKADVREELDRLVAHVAQASKMIGDGGAVGRRLDFLAQEFNRETNTLCAKANDLELTNIGLELKSLVEQFREQVQNLE
jgi:uncharacterized protein YicC (UPF0701 family)